MEIKTWDATIFLREYPVKPKMLASTADGFTSSESTIMEKMVINGAAPHLPGEIIRNILKRLPVKSLMRFQCVCKHWKSLLKTPSFIQDHLRHSTHQNPYLVIGPNQRDDPFYLLSFNCEMQFREFEHAPLVSSLRGICLVGSSNGLLCFAHWNNHLPSPLLWNPATREVRQVPITFDDFSHLGWHFGFGFSPIINDYRIVRVSMNPGVCGVEVYSLSTESWRNIQFDNIKDVCTVNYGVTANGVMFWPGSKRMGADIIHVIVSLDLATEVFKVIPWPDFGLYPRTLAVYEDKLAIISHPKNRKTQDSYFNKWKMWDYSSVYFWVMEEEAIGSSGQRWSSSEKYMGNIRLYDGTFWRNQIVCIELGQGEDKERLYMIDVIANECKLFDIPRPKNGFGIHVFNYVESLVSVSGNIQIEEP